MSDTHTGASASDPAEPGPVPADGSRPPSAGGSRDLRRALRQPDNLIPMVLLGVFLVLWALALTRPNFLTSFDVWVRDRVQNVSHAPDDDLTRWRWLKHLADLGGGVAVHKVPVRIQVPMVTMAVVALAAAAVKRSWRPLAAVAAGYAALGIVLLLKANGHRPGPSMAGQVLNGGLGFFPSGHTANTMMGYGTSALILAFVFTAGWARVVIATAMTLFALAMGFSLVWLDYHWVSDVLGSYALCGAALFGVARILGFRIRATDAAPAAL